MNYQKVLKIKVISVIILGIIFIPFSLLSQDKKEIEIVNDRYFVMNGKKYFFTTEEKSRDMLNKLEKFDNLKEKIRLKNDKIGTLQSIISDKQDIIEDYRSHTDFMGQAFNKAAEINEETFFEKTEVRVLTNSILMGTALFVGVKIGAEN